jgi:hypothetical protein
VVDCFIIEIDFKSSPRTSSLVKKIGLFLHLVKSQGAKDLFLTAGVSSGINYKFIVLYELISCVHHLKWES